MQDKLTPRTLDLARASDYLSVPRETLRSWRKRGVLKGTKVEGRLLFCLEDLDALVERGRDAEAER